MVLIKNIDSYSSKLFEAAQALELVIFSGDLDKENRNKKILSDRWHLSELEFGAQD